MLWDVWKTVHLTRQVDVDILVYVLQNMKAFSRKLKEYNCFCPCIDLCTAQLEKKEWPKPMQMFIQNVSYMLFGYISIIPI